MNIRFFEYTNEIDFRTFNLNSFPKRKSFINDLIDFRYFNKCHNGEFIKNNILAFNDENEIIAQSLYHPAKYYFESKLNEMEWGFDLYVDPRSRNESVGLHLFEYIKANKNVPIFATGVGEKALKIEKFFGYHVIGHLKKYFKIVNPLLFVTGVLQGKNNLNNRFPILINNNGVIFKKVKGDELWNANQAYNADLLEFERSENYLNWRFNSDKFKYSIYKLEKETNDLLPVYFVVRTVKVKGVSCLVLVDYRYNVKDKKDLEMIICAVEKISIKMLIPVIIAGSSHFVSDSVFELHKFKINGKDRPIICNVKDYKIYKTNIEKRDFIFTTFADSDGEYLM